jgi:hypothetical protein
MWLTVDVWHADGTSPDSLKLTFSTQTPNVGADVWLESPDESMSNPVLVYKDHRNAIVNISNMGFMDSGSVAFDLLVQANRPTPITQSYPINVQGEITLHDSNYIFGDYSYTHDFGSPFMRHSYGGQVSLLFSILPNGTVTLSL